MTDAKLSPFLKAVARDHSIPIDSAAVELWLKDLQNPLRWAVRPIFQFLFAVLLHIIWFFKRLPLPQFRAHKFLQWLICWFCRHFVTPEANQLILRHFATESNILNFIRDNHSQEETDPIELYPKTINDMIEASFVEHDQELFRLFAEMGPWQRLEEKKSELVWDHWRDIEIDAQEAKGKWTQFIDFETSHSLFMCLFCLLLTAEEYRDAINGFNLDQSMAIRVGEIIGDSSLVEMAYNKHPLYLVGPWNLSQRFLMHGFFTEYLHARLLELKHD